MRAGEKSFPSFKILSIFEYVMQIEENNHPPKSAIERATEYGIDLTLNIEMLRRTPIARIRLLQEWMLFFESVRLPKDTLPNEAK